MKRHTTPATPWQKSLREYQSPEHTQLTAQCVALSDLIVARQDRLKELAVRNKWLTLRRKYGTHRSATALPGLFSKKAGQSRQDTSAPAPASDPAPTHK